MVKTMNHNESIWKNDNIPKLTNKKFNNNEYDVLIIGAGITGMNISYMLKDKFNKIILIDKSGSGSGITGKTTAKITYLQGNIYSNLNKYNANQYLNSQIDAIKLIKNIISDNI